MQFPNGMYVDGNRMLVTDSKAGAVFETNQSPSPNLMMPTLE